MAAITKPVNLSLTWASGGDILDPGDTKYATGWQVEIPPRQWFNFLDNRQDTALAHINQYGVAVWDASTEYQYETLGEKSLVMGSDGILYRTLDTNTNQNPTTTVGVHWEIAFADSGAFYTKVESDANYLAKAQNLADLPSTPDARTNLSVYAKAETYTKVEVDSKTAVASTPQSQAWASNSVLLTPLRLAEAMQGANRSFTSNGYQKLPSGLILQWGTLPVDYDQTSTVVTFPIAFPTACLGALVTIKRATSVTGVHSAYVHTFSTTQMSILGDYATNPDSAVPTCWFAIGN